MEPGSRFLFVKSPCLRLFCRQVLVHISISFWFLKSRTFLDTPRYRHSLLSPTLLNPSLVVRLENLVPFRKLKIRFCVPSVTSSNWSFLCTRVRIKFLYWDTSYLRFYLYTVGSPIYFPLTSYPLTRLDLYIKSREIHQFYWTLISDLSLFFS